MTGNSADAELLGDFRKKIYPPIKSANRHSGMDAGIQAMDGSSLFSGWLDRSTCGYRTFTSLCWISASMPK